MYVHIYICTHMQYTHTCLFPHVHSPRALPFPLTFIFFNPLPPSPPSPTPAHTHTPSRTHTGTCGNILKNYTQEFKDGNTIAVTMYASVAATIIMSFPLVVQPCRSAFDALFARCLPPADRYACAFCVGRDGGHRETETIVVLCYDALFRCDGHLRAAQLLGVCLRLACQSD